MPDTKLQQPSSLLIKDERKLAALKAQKARESAFKIVVKIISWESGTLDSAVIKSANKITEEEWLKYKKQRMDIATADNRDKAKEKLTLTYNSIKANGGFE
ncbi:MAG: hypothetical protein M1324_00450 [Patescibacteria group bacterium]|nr:hypothetical protein [Patescibacteria group bacterium]